MSENTQETAQFNPLAILPMALGALVVAAFFMPWISVFMTWSGLDLIRAGGDMDMENSWTIAIPAVIGIVAIIVSALRADPLFYGIPAIGVLVVVIYRLLSFGNEMGAELSDSGEILEVFLEVGRVGVYTTVAGLLALFIVSLACRKSLKVSA